MSDDWKAPDFADETLPVLRPKDVARVRAEPRPIDLAGRTHVGQLRDHNEDSFLIADLGRWLDVRESSLVVNEIHKRIPGPKGTLLMVADGMGGHGGGEVASAVAIDAIAQFALYAMPWVTQPDAFEEKELLEQMGDAMTKCQARLEQVAQRKRIDQLQPGTTLTMAFALWPKLYIAHAGDSRLYLMRDGDLTQITTDHTVGQALRDSGALGSEPSRFDHILVNVVGGGGERVRAEAHRLQLQTGDRVLLCSDGLTGHVSDPEIAACLTRSTSSAAACEALVDAANAGGGNDNITAVVGSF